MAQYEWQLDQRWALLQCPMQAEAERRGRSSTIQQDDGGDQGRSAALDKFRRPGVCAALLLLGQTQPTMPLGVGSKALSSRWTRLVGTLWTLVSCAAVLKTIPRNLASCLDPCRGCGATNIDSTKSSAMFDSTRVFHAHRFSACIWPSCRRCRGSVVPHCFVAQHQCGQNIMDLSK